MSADTTPKRTGLKPPPALGSRPASAPDRAGPPASGSGTPGATAESGPPRLSIGTAPRGGASAVPPPPGSGKASAPGTPAGGPTTGPSVRAVPGPATPVASAPGAVAAGPRRAPARRAAPQAATSGRRDGALAPGHTVKTLRRPTGTVRSNAVVADVMRASVALVDLLEEENEALRRHDLDTVKALADRKQKATRYYRERMLKIQKDPGEVTGLPEDEREVVRAMAQYLDAHLAENGRLLKSAKAAGERVMGLFVDAMKRVNAERAAGYAADGRISDSAHNPAGMSLSYNKNL
ncbi:hypothetical protein [Roseospira navarrensis]|uniref:Flagellar basal-body protein FlbY n=1 Tax=Roseospira navarrensis TaxID=140058 RepID=A0A7X1ZAK7_9PROT|nr:hypothetical protein [Roseospira navarrensis]MQX35000.1 hypothetical protein [Roseospira navarrensis]